MPEGTLSPGARALLRQLGRKRSLFIFEVSAAAELVLHGMARRIHSDGVVEITATGWQELQHPGTDGGRRTLLR